jgi:hypothetical protein
MRRFLSRLLVLAGVLLLPASVFAQAAIAGTTKDASGAVMPGVTIEASSPVRRGDACVAPTPTTSYIRSRRPQ